MRNSVGTMAALFLVACAVRPDVEQLRTRAAFDLQCPEDQLQLVELEEGARGVVGCGRRATYLHLCNVQGGMSMNCNWVSNSSGGNAVPGAAHSASASASVYIPPPPKKPEPPPFVPP